MAERGKIKLFQFIQKTYQEVGLLAPQSNQKCSRINTKNCLILFCHAQLFITSACYSLFEGRSMLDYGMVFFTCTTAVFGFITYLILLWQMDNILSYIEHCERFIEKSECCPTLKRLFMRYVTICLLQGRIQRSSIKTQTRKSKNLRNYLRSFMAEVISVLCYSH